jgi:DNA-binding beta-propeller fold protein YncE
MQKMVLPGEWDNASIPTPPFPNRRGRRAKKRKLVVIAAVVLLVMALTGGSALALLKFNPTLLSNMVHHDKQKDQRNTLNSGSPSPTTMMNNTDQAVTSITNLAHISVVGSTAFIVDGHGKTVSADANPYGIAIAPNGMTPGALKPGDILVTNFGAMNTGTTLVRFPAGKGPGLLFNAMTNPGTKGPAFEAFNPLTGTDWVANFSGNNVQVFNPNGTLKVTITSPLFKMPWAMASNNGKHNAMDGAVGSFFTTNTGDATIDRIDVIPTKNGTTFRVFQIGQLTQVNGGTKLNAIWVPSLQIGGQRFSDVLLVLDLANNRVAAYPNSTTINTTMTPSTSKGMTAFQGKPLNAPAGLTINPLNGDLLVVNMNDNNLVEVNLAQGKAVGTRLLDIVPVDAQSGNGSALFGVAAATDAKGNLEVFFTDDNMNTLNMLSV